MSEEKKRSLVSFPSLDSRLLGVAALCSMYEVFSKEFFNLCSCAPSNAVRISQLQTCMDLTVEALRLRLGENRAAELDLGFGRSVYGEEETE